jgi:hypothetical protein
MPARPQVAPTEDWRQIELPARAPGQRTYELNRPVVLFGRSAAERALYRQLATRSDDGPPRGNAHPCRRGFDA